MRYTDKISHYADKIRGADRKALLGTAPKAIKSIIANTLTELEIDEHPTYGALSLSLKDDIRDALVANDADSLECAVGTLQALAYITRFCQ